MAEKEEKIYVYRFTEDDGICHLEEICTKFPAQCGHCKEIPTRAETIERMAKAICNMGDEETWGRVDDNYKHYCTAQAEWALKALLGDK